MSRMIDADELKTAFPCGERVTTECVRATIDNMPTVEERKTGRWILHENQRQEDVNNGNYLYICSECGKSDLHAKTQKVPFCWWCGAKMEVAHERQSNDDV